MGSRMFGGRVESAPGGETVHGDHGYAQYFVPEETREFPIIMWHGLGQSGKTWETTVDGREGFWQLFLRQHWSVYVIDQPRRGRAGRALSTDAGGVGTGVPLNAESAAWTAARIGEWYPPGPRRYYPGVAFAGDDQAADQFFRQQTPSTGPEPFPNADYRRLVSGAVLSLLDEVGPSILMTHSHSGQFGWETAMRDTASVRAIVSLEPGEYAFPDDAPPSELDTTSDLLRTFMAPQLVAAARFDELTRIPILIIFGDNISPDPSENFELELWRLVRQRSQQFVDTINSRGGDATLIDLPQLGMRGNTHFLMGDTNNDEVAAQIFAFLASRELDRRHGE